MLSARASARRSGHSLSVGHSADSQGGLAPLQARPPTLLAHDTDDLQAPAPAPQSRLAPATATAPAAPARTRRRSGNPPTGTAPSRKRAAGRCPAPRLGALLVLAGLLNLWALGQNGWANEYYSAAVRSMSGSWHNFLFGSFDAQGLMTVDKPPLALWVQALSVKAFGFNSWASWCRRR